MRSVRTESRVAVVRVGADARFHVALEPGRYSIRPLVERKSILAPLNEHRVRVWPHRFTQVVLRFWLSAP